MWERCAIVVAILIFGACGAPALPRDDAIAILQLEGMSAAEATCVADTLVLAEELDAVDPRFELDDRQITALQSARLRCQSTEALEVDGGFGDVPDDVIVAPSSVDTDVAGVIETAVGGVGQEPVADDVIDAAVDALRALGRDEITARCIVERLVDTDGTWLFDDERFGFGANPLEAAATAACI